MAEPNPYVIDILKDHSTVSVLWDGGVLLTPNGPPAAGQQHVEGHRIPARSIVVVLDEQHLPAVLRVLLGKLGL